MKKKIINSTIIASAVMLGGLYPLATNVEQVQQYSVENKKVENKEVGNEGIDELFEFDLNIDVSGNSFTGNQTLNPRTPDQLLYWFNNYDHTFGATSDVQLEVNYSGSENGYFMFDDHDKTTTPDDIKLTIGGVEYYHPKLIYIPDNIYERGYDEIVKFLSILERGGYYVDTYSSKGLNIIDQGGSAHYVLESGSNHINFINPIMLNVSWNTDYANIDFDIDDFKYDLWAEIDGFDSNLYLKNKKSISRINEDIGDSYSISNLNRINYEGEFSYFATSSFDNDIEINGKKYDVITQWDASNDYYWPLPGNVISNLSELPSISISDSNADSIISQGYFYEENHWNMLVPITYMNEEDFEIVNNFIINGDTTGTTLSSINTAYDDFCLEISSKLDYYFGSVLNTANESSGYDYSNNYFEHDHYLPETETSKYEIYVPKIIEGEVYVQVPMSSFLKIDTWENDDHGEEFKKILNGFREFLGEDGFEQLILNLDLFVTSEMEIDTENDYFHTYTTYSFDLDNGGVNKDGLLSNSEIWLLVVTIISILGLGAIIFLLIRKASKEDEGVVFIMETQEEGEE